MELADKKTPPRKTIEELRSILEIGGMPFANDVPSDSIPNEHGVEMGFSRHLYKIDKMYFVIVIGVFILLLYTRPSFIMKKYKPLEAPVVVNAPPTYIPPPSISFLLFIKYWIILSVLISIGYYGYSYRGLFS